MILGVDRDVVQGSAAVPGDDFLGGGVERFPQKCFSAGSGQPVAHGLEHPQSRVGGVVFGSLAAIRETVGN